tara:strand:- start:3503 stop:3997 length:495 start_codon:yes stop_codon:yes gene_type:complete
VSHHIPSATPEPDIRERQGRAIQLRRSGASYRDIGTALEVSHEQARRDVFAGLERIDDEYAQDRKVLRPLMLERYERLLLAYWQKALDGDTQAATTVLSILAAIRRITGLDPKEPVIIDNRTQVLRIEDLAGSALETLEALGYAVNGHQATGADGGGAGGPEQP